MPGLCEMHLSGSWPGLTLPRASFSCFSDAACFMLASRTILWASWEGGRLCVSGEGPARGRQTRSRTRPPTRPPAGRPRYLKQAGRQLLQLPFQLLPHLGQPLALLILQLQLLRGPGRAAVSLAWGVGGDPGPPIGLHGQGPLPRASEPQPPFLSPYSLGCVSHFAAARCRNPNRRSL